MKLSTLLKSVSFTLKMYRLFWMTLVMVTVVLPFTYLVVVVMFSGGNPESLATGLTGFLVMTSFSALVYPTAISIANMFEEQALELYATLPVSLRVLLASNVISQLIFSSTPVVLGVVALVLIAGNVHGAYMALGLVYSTTIFSFTALILGLSVRSRYKLEPVLMSLMMLVIVATPLYYRLFGLTKPLREILVANPVTHIVCLLRLGIGLSEGVPAEVSIAYLTALSLALFALTWYKTRGGVLTVIEKR
ncbi:MAG: hypothetical protein QW432_02990 [Desulfurococcaceae archaeon]